MTSDLVDRCSATVLTTWALASAVGATRRRPRRAIPPTNAAARPRDALNALLRRLQPGLAAGRDAAALPEAVDAIASAVGAGRSMSDGLVAAAATAPAGLAAELRAVVALAERGVALTVAVDRWASRSAVPGAPLVAAAVGLAGDAGGDVEIALVGVAGTLRERRALSREIRALSSQARLSAAVIATAPMGFASVAVAADGDIAEFVLGTPPGLGCLAAGVALDLAGWRWMRRITRSVQ